MQLIRTIIFFNIYHYDSKNILSMKIVKNTLVLFPIT